MISFAGALININAISDTHGMVKDVASAYQTMQDNSKKMFLKEQPGNANFLMVSGDWYMAGDTKGYLSDPKKTSQDYQLLFFNKFVSKIKKDHAKNLKTFFAIGNHDTDAGVKALNASLRNMDATAVCTNLDYENSFALKEQIENKKLVKSKVVEVEDDKDPNKTHKVLVVGLSPVNMSYYNKKNEGLAFIDDVKKPQIEITQEDYQKTLDTLNKEIEDFKEKYPKGLVILMGHSGSNIAENLAKESGKINLILDGHEHKDYKTKIGNTALIKLGKEFEKIENIKIKLDDDGNIVGGIQRRKFEVEKDEKPKNHIAQFFKKVLKRDLSREYNIEAKDANLAVLSKKNIRSQNSDLVNYVSDIILYKTRQLDPSVEFFGINASAIRGSLVTSKVRPANNLDLMLVLNGLKETSADIYKNKVTGSELAKIISSNVRFNAMSEEKNPLVHYSGLVIDKAIRNLDLKNASQKELCSYVIDERTQKPIEPERIYTIANPEKWLIKSEYFDIQRLREEAEPIKNANAKKIFIKYFEGLANKKAKDIVSPEQKKRIIDTSA